MKATRVKLVTKSLPPDYQEVLITHEMQFEKQNINLDLIRKFENNISTMDEKEINFSNQI